jgi:uncharacterized membrane protein
MLLSMGTPVFSILVVSIFWFAYSLRKSQPVLMTFAVLIFFLVASTNNSLASKTPALTIFAAAAYGLRRLPQRARKSAFPAFQFPPALRRG